jgi:hypothetical protein
MTGMNKAIISALGAEEAVHFTEFLNNVFFPVFFLSVLGLTQGLHGSALPLELCPWSFCFLFVSFIS